ncbi:MAG: ArnT family glycosyltransferase [Planctomycetota bacterium]|jgi:4-amino-4-deoxy-L-arabinose transferase-like glycosyltransferase
MSRGRRIRRRDEWIAAAAVLLVLVVGLTGPDDGWAHTQPRTMAYAVDLAAGGSWVLPQDEEGRPSTKPPLHPWLAAPAVAVTGSHHRVAHLWPDLAAAIATGLAMVVAGRRWWPRSGGQVGAVAATIWITSVSTMKLAAIARPDMLLVAGTALAWIAFTDMLVRPATSTGDPGDRRAWLVAAGIAVGGLAKGPAVLPLLPGLWLAARWAGPGGRGAEALAAVLRPGVLAAAFLPPLAWLSAAAASDPAWVLGHLLGAEVLDRITGRLPDVGGDGPGLLLRTLAHMPAYLGLRFLPWTVPLVLAAILCLRPGLTVRPRGLRPSDMAVPRAAIALVAATVLVLSLSAGKRADYLGPCLPAAAMAAAWWLVRGDRRVHAEAPWALWLSAGVLVTMQAIHLRRPSDGLPASVGPAIAEVASQAHRMAAAESLPVMVLGSAGTSLPLRLGRVPADPPERFGRLVAEGKPFLLASANLGPCPVDLAVWAAAHPGVRTAEALVDHRGARTGALEGLGDAGPGAWAVGLVRVEPHAPARSWDGAGFGFKGFGDDSR